MHIALQSLYESDFAAKPAVGLKDDDKFTPELKKGLFRRLTEWIHKNKGFNPEHLDDPEPYGMIKDTYRVISKPLHDIAVKQEVSPELTSALEQNAFMFSGFKIFHESNEMASMLKGDDGSFKSYDKFEQDVLAIDEAYNHNYLRAEYNFATNSTLSAVRWQNYAKDGDRYNLQYRTALDERVREEHRMLEGITLPPSDKFWDKYYPPNGWNCRCTVVQVLKDKYPTSNSDQACASGERATTQIGKDGSNKAAIFRFNPGKSMKIMPPKHPYLPKGCGDCSYNKLAYNPNSEKCQACRELLKMVRSVQEKTIAADKAKTVAAIKSIKQTIPPYDGIVMPGKIFETGKMTMLRRSFDDIYEHAIENEDVRKWLQSFSIDNLNELKYKGWAYCHPYPKDHHKYDSANPLKSKHDTDTEYFLYYTIKIGKRDYWVNVKMHKEYGEVVYTIEKEKPHDIIKGHKKK